MMVDYENMSKAELISVIEDQQKRIPEDRLDFLTEDELASMMKELSLKSTHDPETGCFTWGGDIDKQGYGKVFQRIKKLDYSSFWFKVHRVAMFARRGKSIAGLTVRNKCGNNRCYSEDHLFLKSAIRL